MTTTTYGYKIPDSGDRAKGSSGWMQMVTYNFDRLDAHTHNGIDSPSLPYSSLAPYSTTISALSWSADGAGYKQTITVPVGVTDVNIYNLKFVATAPAGIVGQPVDLGYKRLTATTFEVYCNDNTTAFTVYFR